MSPRIVLPHDPDYDSSRQAYNARFDIRPGAIIYCHTSSDVREALALARGQNKTVSIRSGGHSYEGYSLVNDGFVIDVSQMSSIVIDSTRKVAKIGAGCLLGEAKKKLYSQGFAVPFGAWSKVGLAGITLGGGYGFLSRAWGLTCDALTELSMIDAEGQEITANASQDEDLFWAHRGGGGGNFGIVTSLTFGLREIDYVTRFELTWPSKSFIEVVDAWQNWATNVEDKLTSALILGTGDPLCIGVYLGPKSDYLREVKPLWSRARPTSHKESYEPYARLDKGLAEEDNLSFHKDNTGRRFKNSSGYAETYLPSSVISLLECLLHRSPSSSCRVMLDAYGGAINRVSKTDTAFYHRNTLFSLQYQAYWDEAHQDASHIAWIESLVNEMSPHLSAQAYINYIDRTMPNWPRAYYGGNLERLKEVKAKYDPSDYFLFPQSLSEA